MGWHPWLQSLLSQSSLLTPSRARRTPCDTSPRIFCGLSWPVPWSSAHARIFSVQPCSCSSGYAIDSGANEVCAGDEVVGGALGTAAVGEKPVSRLSSTRGVQSCCASRGALLVSISANIIRTALAACPLQLQTRLKASKPWQPALDRAVERSCKAGICS